MSTANKAFEDNTSSSEAFVSNGAGNDISAFSQASSIDSFHWEQAQTKFESETESELKSQCDSESASESELTIESKPALEPDTAGDSQANLNSEACDTESLKSSKFSKSSKTKDEHDGASADGKDDEIDAWQKLYTSFRRRRFGCFIFLGVWGLRLPLLFWLTEEQQSLDDILYLRDFDLWFSVPAPLLAALLFLFLGRTKAALAGTALVVLAFALLLDRDPEFALSRPEIMCAAITVGVIWTIWALAGRIKVLKSLGL